MARRTKEETKAQILLAAAKLFLKNGYSKTKISDIASESNIPYTEIFRRCTDKESILKDLVGLVIRCQFEFSRDTLFDITNDKMFIYAFEAVLQLYIAESTEHLREMYTVSYSLQNSSKEIYKTVSSKLEDVFKEHLPHFQTKDFYELEIATAGIMRGYLSIPCDMYFTIDRKVTRFIESAFKIYDVSNEKINEILNFINKFDFNLFSSKVNTLMLEYLQKNISMSKI